MTTQINLPGFTAENVIPQMIRFRFQPILSINKWCVLACALACGAQCISCGIPGSDGCTKCADDCMSDCARDC